jgi:transcriptional accessory protein Tex/SPT6
LTEPFEVCRVLFLLWFHARNYTDKFGILQPGQLIKVVILKIDHERKRLSLGLMQLTASPYDNIDEEYAEARDQAVGSLSTGPSRYLATRNSE